MIDETDATDTSVLRRRGDAAEQPIIVRTTLDSPVIVDTTLPRPRTIETTPDVGAAVPSIREGEAVEAPLAVPAAPLPTAPAASPPRLRIGPFQIADLSRDDIVSAIVSGTMGAERAWVSFALHVGGLNERRNTAYLHAMASADLVYADGMSVIVLAKLAGASAAERAGTTDIGWTVMRQLSLALGRPARVALIGGPDGLTRRAARVIEADTGAEVVLTEHGYHKDWTPVLDRLAISGCDLVFVGLGAPKEMSWVNQHVEDLPPCLVMTCGGWFGFITQDEKRAPQWVCDAGLEWTYRLAQNPRRLVKRYAKGALSTGQLAVEIRRTRTRSA